MIAFQASITITLLKYANLAVLLVVSARLIQIHALGASMITYM
jgi:hypothetical protein